MNHSRIATSCVCCGSQLLKKSPAILMPFIADRVFNWKPVEIDASWGLLTVPQGRAYSICNSLLCDSCGLLFLDIRFDDQEMQRLYSDYRGPEYASMRESYEPGYGERNSRLLRGATYLPEIESFLAPFLPRTLKILDWGGDTGVNTPFRNSHNTIHIYDISNVTTEASTQQVTREFAQTQSYDLIICSNVLEHTPYPAATLEEIGKVMRTGTVLYLEIPFEDLVRNYSNRSDFIEMKRHWHEHINFFNLKSIESLLLFSKMDVLEIRELPIQTEGQMHSQFMVACRKSS